MATPPTQPMRIGAVHGSEPPPSRPGARSEENGMNATTSPMTIAATARPTLRPITPSPIAVAPILPRVQRVGSGRAQSRRSPGSRRATRFTVLGTRPTDREVPLVLKPLPKLDPTKLHNPVVVAQFEQR